MSRRKSIKDKVTTISGRIWNDNTRTVAIATNRNAEVLKALCEEVEILSEAIGKIADTLEQIKEEKEC